jgi:ocular albinism type 1 protein
MASCPHDHNCSGFYPSCCGPHLKYYIYFGDPIETILRFAYTATYIWTLVFAVDTFYRARTRSVVNSKYYHWIVWSVSAMLAGSHLVIVFTGTKIGRACANKDRLIGSYSLLYLPMLVVMISNPLLYYCTTHQYKRRLWEAGLFSARERKELKDHKYMFLIYIVVFYSCWVASLVYLIFASITLFDSLSNLKKVPLPVWIVNAITNPLQGFLNSLTYGRFGKSIYTDPHTKIGTEHSQEKLKDDRSGEHEDLIRGRRH